MFLAKPECWLFIFNKYFFQNYFVCLYIQHVNRILGRWKIPDSLAGINGDVCTWETAKTGELGDTGCSCCGYASWDRGHTAVYIPNCPCFRCAFGLTGLTEYCNLLFSCSRLKFLHQAKLCAFQEKPVHYFCYFFFFRCHHCNNTSRHRSFGRAKRRRDVPKSSCSRT